MDAIELLKHDHRKVESLFQTFNDGGGLTGVVKRLTGNAVSPARRRTLAQKIMQELEVHTRIEEQVFYPAVRALEDERLDKLVGESMREHATAKKRLQAARAALGDEEELRTRMGEVQECVDHHVREEEHEMFPLLEDRMPSAERAALGRQLASQKRSAGPARRTTKRAVSGHATATRTRKTTAKAGKKTTARKRASGGGRR